MPFDLLKKYSNEIQKQFNNVASYGLLNEIISNVPYCKLILKETLDNQHEILSIQSDKDFLKEKKI